MSSLKKSQKKIWFVRKIYGYGWTPSKWQGWLVVLIFILLFTLNNYYFFDTNIKNPTIYSIIINSVLNISLIIGLIYISYKKGEKPRWSWGK